MPDFPDGSVRDGGVGCPSLGVGVPGGTSQQQDTHIGELGDIYYPWHPWHDHKVRVHATLVKRGRTVARCHLEDVPTSRMLEVPLWMLDAATCCQMRTAESSIVEVASLRELK